MCRIIYYSETGNTELIARSVAGSVPDSDLVRIGTEESPLTTIGGLLYVGTPVHSDNMPERVAAYFSAVDLSSATVAVFVTHTGPMDDESILLSVSRIKEYFTQKTAAFAGLWHCQAENKRPDVVEWLKVNMPERYRKALSAIGLPLSEDIRGACEWAEEIFKNHRQGVQ